MSNNIELDGNGCYRCESSHKVKARFGLAWVAESPDCPDPEPIGWQVEFLDTPSKVEQNCQEMVRWINCPPLPKCEPCPPEELCCGRTRCCRCKNQNQNQNQNHNQKPPSCHCKKREKESNRERRKCCCCEQQQQQQQKKKWCPVMGPPCCCNRNRSPRRNSPYR